MNPRLAFALLLSLSAGTVAAQPALGGRPQLQVQPQHQLKPQHQIKPQVIRTACPDPAVSLQVGWPSRNANGSYSFRLVATITNRGQARFHSRRNQTQLSFREGNRVLKAEAWTSRALDTVTLEPGASVSDVYTVTNWHPGSEFLAPFSAQIGYDPDIAIDGNPENDDCRSGNNRAVLTVEQIRQALPR